MQCIVMFEMITNVLGREIRKSQKIGMFTYILMINEKSIIFLILMISSLTETINLDPVETV